jgi:hypothetical protein
MSVLECNDSLPAGRQVALPAKTEFLHSIQEVIAGFGKHITPNIKQLKF